MTLPFPLLNDAADLARFRDWSETENGKFPRLQRGEMSEGEFGEKHRWRHVILGRDVPGVDYGCVCRGAEL